MARIDFISRDTINIAGQGGQGDALLELGLIWSTGRDGVVDLVQAHKWFNLAASRGNDAAKRYRTEVAQLMTKAEVAQAQKLARQWLSSLH